MSSAPAKAKRKKGPILVFVAASALVIIPFWIFCGIIVSAAVGGFVDYTARAKASEAPFELHNIALLEERWCVDHGDYLVPAGPVPARPGPRQQISNFASDPTFARLGFAPTEPRYYSYSIGPESTGASGIEIFAHGDLDGDGTLSSISLTCGAGCRCETRFYIENETE